MATVYAPLHCPDRHTSSPCRHASFDDAVPEVEAPIERPAPPWWRRRSVGRSAAAALGGVAACLVVTGSLSWRRGTRADETATVAEFDLPSLPGVPDNMMDMGIMAYKKVLGGADPFKFQCPLPGLGALTAFNRSAGQPEFCCSTYDTLGWPYQFPECVALSNCTSCFKHSDKASTQHHPVAPLAGVAWASSLAVYSKAKPKSGWLGNKLSELGDSMLGGGKVGDTTLRDHRLTATVGLGMGEIESDLCPELSDWDETMLNDESDNIHARVLKSEKAQLAVVVFRGTQMTSIRNWQVDANLDRTKLPLGDGYPDAEVHEGFLKSLKRVLPRVKKWLVGSMFGLLGSIPKDWKLVFTGHSLGGALAVLAATMAELQDWRRKPDAVVVFGAPRVADGALSAWWKDRGMCKKLLRVNTYNDVIHYMPLKTAWKWWEVAKDLASCAADFAECVKKGPHSLLAGGGGLAGNAMEFSDRWDHVCDEESEFLVESATKGVNEQLDDFSAIGGAMSHFIDNCRYGYSFGVLRSGLVKEDQYCGISRSICKETGEAK